MTETIKAQVPGWIPYVIGAVLVVQFFALGVWQISRGLEKTRVQDAFAAQSGYSAWTDGMDVRPFQKLKATGTFDSQHQILLENIIVNSRIGFYALTPLRIDEHSPLLLVNRGWFERSGTEPTLADLEVPQSRLSIRGRAGSLPRAGYRMGEAVSPGSGWPRKAVYPTLDELAATLGEPVQPFVLLLDPEDDFGFLRQWVPEEMGPGRHYAYALQWFAMGVVLAGLLVWNFRKRGLES